jgi:hypothetical protein
VKKITTVWLVYRALTGSNGKPRFAMAARATGISAVEQASKAGNAVADGQPAKQERADAVNGRHRGEHFRLLGDAVTEDGAVPQDANQRPRNGNGKRAQHKASNRRHAALHPFMRILAAQV